MRSNHFLSSMLLIFKLPFSTYTSYLIFSMSYEITLQLSSFDFSMVISAVSVTNSMLSKSSVTPFTVSTASPANAFFNPPSSEHAARVNNNPPTSTRQIARTNKFFITTPYFTIKFLISTIIFFVRAIEPLVAYSDPK